MTETVDVTVVDHGLEVLVADKLLYELTLVDDSSQGLV